MMHDSPSLPVAVYLRSDRLGLRAPERADARHASAWYEGPAAITPERAEELLVAQETIPWGNNPTLRLIAIDLATGQIVGGALVERADNRVSKLRLTARAARRSGEERQRECAEMLRIILPWVMDELDLMIATVDVPADEAIVIEAARAMGMRQAVRLREHVARPAGRIDLLMFEAVNRAWGRGGTDA